MQRDAKTKAATERHYRALLERRQRSGQSLRAFAASEGIPVGTLSYWQFELRRRDRERGSGERVPTFLPVKLTTEAPVSEQCESCYEIVLGKRTIRVSRGFDATMVTALVQAVEAASC